MVGSWPHPQTLDQAERLARDKCSSLLRKVVIYVCKKFYNIDTWWQKLAVDFPSFKCSIYCATAFTPEIELFLFKCINRQIGKCLGSPRQPNVKDRVSIQKNFLRSSYNKNMTIVTSMHKPNLKHQVTVILGILPFAIAID